MKFHTDFTRTALAVAAVCLCTIVTLGNPAGAAYLDNVPQTLQQPNGDVIQCFASGDEFYNYLHDANGYVIKRNPDTGYYMYAVKRDGDIVPSRYIVGTVDPALVGLEKNIMPDPEILRARHERWLVPATADMGPDMAAPTSGTINNIVIFIRFSGESEFTENISGYDDMFNETTAGYNSMRNYYSEVSYGTLAVSTTFYPNRPGTTVVSYQDSHTRNYYRPYNATTNPDGYEDSERNAREFALLKAAVDGVSGDIPGGLNVDGDGDGNCDNVCFIVKGGADGWNDLLWPHHWELYGENAQINGKRVWDFNLQLQNSLASSGVGVLCHEMFHSMGAPDLYHYYTSKELDPADIWDIMEHDQNPPQHMSAFMKYKYGKWIASIPEITTPGTYTLHPQTSSTNNCYRIASPNSTMNTSLSSIDGMRVHSKARFQAPDCLSGA